jgi:glycosyltransferase involved in cell wall biosynthesis
MKILFLSDDFPPESFGGAGIVAFNIAKKLKSLGNDISVITVVSDKTKEGIVEYEGIKVFKIHSSYHERWRGYLSLYNPFAVRKVEKIISQEKPDVVHAHNIHYYLSYYSLKLANKYSKAVFLTAHDAMSYAYGKVLDESKISFFKLWKSNRLRFNPFRNILIKIFLNKYVDKIFSVSESLKRALVNNGIKNVEVIHNGIDCSDWKGASNNEVKDFRELLGILPNKKVILFGGRLSGMKGGNAVIDAFNIIVKKAPETVLLIAGTKNEYAEKMLDYAKELGIEKNIIFTGWLSRDKMKLVFDASDVVVVASLYLDPFNLINLEAMASKKPVIGTCFGGAPEIVQDGVTGYIVNPFDVETMAVKIIDLLKNPQKARQFGEAGYERAKKHFSLDSQIAKTLAWYQKMLDDKEKSLKNQPPI